MNFTALAYPDVLLDMALEPGWDSDYENFDIRMQEREKLYSLIESESVRVYAPLFLVTLAHIDAKHRIGAQQAQRVVDRTLEFANSRLSLDEERILDQANTVTAFPGDTDLYDVVGLIYGQELNVDAIITRNPKVLQQIIARNRTTFSKFDVRILTLGAFTNLVCKTQNSRIDDGSIIYALTPDNMVIQLPSGATPVDFAYKIHTKVGDRCIEARVNEEVVPLDYVLRTGDVVKILKGPEASPDPIWLNFVVTGIAKKCIQRGIRRINRQRGWELIKQALGVNIGAYRDRLEYFAEQLGRTSLDDLVIGIGSSEVYIDEVTAFIQSCTCYPTNRHLKGTSSMDHSLTQIDAENWRIASCCRPLPGGSAVGVLEQGKRAIPIHRTDCINIKSFKANQLLPIPWHSGYWRVQLQLIMTNHPDTLRPILNELAANSITPDLYSVNASPDETARASIHVVVTSNHALTEVIKHVEKMPKVLQVKVRRVSSIN